MTVSSTCSCIGRSTRTGYANPGAGSACDFHDGDRVTDLTEVAMVPAAPGTAWASRHSGPSTDGKAACRIRPREVPRLIQIGNEGGFLPKPVVLPNQPINWNVDPTLFTAGLVLQQNAGRRHAPVGSGRTGGRHRRLHRLCRPYPDPLQRRTGAVAGPRPALRLLHGRSGPAARKWAVRSRRCRARVPTPGPSCRSWWQATGDAALRPPTIMTRLTLAALADSLCRSRRRLSQRARIRSSSGRGITSVTELRCLRYRIRNIVPHHLSQLGHSRRSTTPR